MQFSQNIQLITQAIMKYLKVTGQSRNYTLQSIFLKKIRLKNKGRFQRKQVLIFFLVVLRKLVNFNEFQYYFILNLRYIHTSLYTFSGHIINHNIDYWSMTEQL